MTTATLFVAVGLGAVHIFGDRIAAVLSDSHHRWLSVGGGTTVAFIFLYLLPELDYFRRILEEHPATGQIDRLLYLSMLGGVIVYYGLEHLGYRFRQPMLDDDSDGSKNGSTIGHDYVFWLHMGWYGLYNAIIGALLLYGEQETVHGLVLYGMAIAIHFSTVDASMRRHHRQVYHGTGRWVLAATVVAGWALGYLLPLTTVAIAGAMAFVAGGLLINAVKDELPSSRRARFIPFLGGVIIFGTLLVVV